jgi:hypothetical protein
MKAALIALFVLLSPASFGAADIDSGNHLLPFCKALLDGRPHGAMAGFCAGVIETLISLKDEDLFCTPAGSTREQSQRVVVRYLENHPDQLHLDFKQLALSALQQAWPCRK